MAKGRQRNPKSPPKYIVCRSSELFVRFGSFNRTYACASTAFETFVSVDNVLAVLFGNAFYRTFSSTSAAADAIV